MTSGEGDYFAQQTDAHMTGASSESSSSDMGIQEDSAPVPQTKLKMRALSGQDWCDDEDDEEEDDEDLEEGEGEDDKGGPHATLASHGPAVSEGSKDHPNECMPCTFYCFTKRGCNRGKDCRFCHLTHQSKLQQRREAWKKQQREKRKSIRERARKEASVPKGVVPVKDNSPNTQSNQAFSRRAEQSRPVANNIADNGSENTRMTSSKTPMMTNKDREPTLTYRPTANVLLVVGQEVYLEPSIDCVALGYRLKVPLPHGLALDQATGIIHGSPTVAAAKRTILVEADVLHVGTVRGSLEFEVVDLLSKDLAIGHLSEIEPGKFVVLVHQPENPPSDMGKHDYSRQQRGMRGNTTRGLKTKAMQGMMMQNSEDTNFMMMRQGAHMPNVPVLMQPCL